ncbi:hypothetical protein [Streptomyces rubiginosohelvolus]|uniref:Uncharacterized protein n=1 Tax=Streptomyces rubiginosohelvolus TaxID=67362 RepID=A0ABQ3CDK4_9ACTN|nr:hypothetical protein [Streptomyces pluricolorescens]GGZ83598.1 hypothetical protein GCM10010328_67330 [Streptomyces pluricolorescens]
MANPQLTAASFMSRSIEDEQRRFAQEAERLAEQAARIAANPPGVGRSTVSGDLTRLIQEATFLLKRSVTIEAGLEAVGLMNAETATTEQ